MRNVIKQAKIGRDTIKGNQDLTAEEFRQIFEIYETTAARTGRHIEGLRDVVATAYYMGYAVGRKTK